MDEDALILSLDKVSKCHPECCFLGHTSLGGFILVEEFRVQIKQQKYEDRSTVLYDEYKTPGNLRTEIFENNSASIFNP